MSETIRVAGIGAGFFSQFHYAAWHRLPGADLCAAVDSDIAKARRVSAEHGGDAFDDVDRMLDKVRPDLVDIITPPASHTALIGKLAGRVATIIYQKPFTPDVAQATAAADLAEARGTRLVVHENFRFQPWYRRISADLDAGDLGDVYQATFRLRPGDGQGPGA